MTHAYQENNLSALERTVSIQSWLLVGTKVVLCKKPYHSAMCFGKPLFSSTGKSWLVQWWEYLCPRARACRHHGRLRVPVLAGDRRTWRRSTQNKRRWRKCLFIRFAGAKAHCNNVGPFSNLQTLHVPVSKIWQPLISYLDFFTQKKWSWIAGHTSQSLSGPRLVEAKGPQQLPGLQLRPPAVDDHGNLVNMTMDRITGLINGRESFFTYIYICMYICTLYTMVK